MDYHEFISSTMCNFNQDVFNAAKEALISEYLFFSIIPDEDVTVSILSEKACDYFDKLALKTGNDFDKQIDAYIKAVDLIVSRRVAQTPKRKKKMLLLQWFLVPESTMKKRILLGKRGTGKYEIFSITQELCSASMRQLLKMIITRFRIWTFP